jgi:ABC-type polysaccharide/polyol phosphate transport system ATPase subunit
LPSASEAGALAVRVEDLSVRYRTTYERVPTLKSALMRLGRRQRGVRVVEALRQVTFDVPHGTVLGIIGANGAGKSTLLRAIAGILPPSEGRIEVRGRVSTLLALGVGFNKSLSGRENVVLGGLAAGMSLSEVEEHYDTITKFADLGDFIDLPMRTYSSGMYGRLAFAVAAFMDPDILLIDEALSTGDAAFRKRSFDKVCELCSQARTILLVSHGLGTLQELATECLWLHKGEIRARGLPADVIQDYTDFAEVAQSTVVLEDV